MKTIGLIGGMSWESSLEYYRILNEEVKHALGDNHSAKCILYSVDFEEVERLQNDNDWDKLTKLMIEWSLNVKHAGADCLVICTNTMHKMVPAIRKVTQLPVIHIAEETGKNIVDLGLKKVALLGTKFTMEGNFYKEKLNDYGIEVLIPNDSDRQDIHDIIYKELVKGEFLDVSRKRYVEVIEALAAKGAEGVVLGCTEIPLLIKQEDVSIPIFDTTSIHAKGAVKYALEV